MSRVVAILLVLGQALVVAVLWQLFGIAREKRSTLEDPVWMSEWAEDPEEDGVRWVDFRSIHGVRLQGTSIPISGLHLGRVEGAFSIVAEIEVDQYPERDVPLVARWGKNYGTHSIYLGLSDEGKLLLGVSESGNIAQPPEMKMSASRHRAPRHRPIHVAVVFEPGERMEIYLDGKLDRKVEHSENIPMRAFPSRLPLIIGSIQSGPKWTHLTYRDFAGTFGPIYIFDRALTADEIAREAEAQGYPTKGPPRPKTSPKGKKARSGKATKPRPSARRPRSTSTPRPKPHQRGAHEAAEPRRNMLPSPPAR